MPPLGYVTDTTLDALDVQLACFRRLTPQERLRKMTASSRRGRDLALAAIRNRNPGMPEEQVRLCYLALAYGDDLAADVRQWIEERWIENRCIAERRCGAPAE
jgi:hypothetical protein